MHSTWKEDISDVIQPWITDQFATFLCKTPNQLKKIRKPWPHLTLIIDFFAPISTILRYVIINNILKSIFLSTIFFFFHKLYQKLREFDIGEEKVQKFPQHRLKNHRIQSHFQRIPQLSYREKTISGLSTLPNVIRVLPTKLM